MHPKTSTPGNAPERYPSGCRAAHRHLLNAQKNFAAIEALLSGWKRR